MEPKIKTVYRCPECDAPFELNHEAAYHCVEMPPIEYQCLMCSFIWPTDAQAIRCYEVDMAQSALSDGRLYVPARDAETLEG